MYLECVCVCVCVCVCQCQLNHLPRGQLWFIIIIWSLHWLLCLDEWVNQLLQFERARLICVCVYIFVASVCVTVATKCLLRSSVYCLSTYNMYVWLGCVGVSVHLIPGRITAFMTLIEHVCATWLMDGCLHTYLDLISLSFPGYFEVFSLIGTCG